jgi:hypothetical protein
VMLLVIGLADPEVSAVVVLQAGVGRHCWRD